MASVLQRNPSLLLCFIYLHIIGVISSDYFSYQSHDSGSNPAVYFVEYSPHERHVRQVPVPQKVEPRQSNQPTATATKKPKLILPNEGFDDVYSDDGLNTTKQEDDFTVSKDYHSYYNSTFYTQPDKWHEYWVDMEVSSIAFVHETLSNAYRKGATITLSFDFPFYGHSVRNVTLTTGGFIFMGEHVHSWLAATQYIAPLMANFDPSLKNTSMVKYKDNGTAFTVQWENVHLKDRLSAGNFTFQATLLKSGDIVFVYREVPIDVTAIVDDEHPVKVGLSDAYIIDRTIFFLRRKTIYEYHRVDVKKPNINNTTSIYFTALQTCVGITDCNECQNTKSDFSCAWCSGRCSDGLDRHRQDWILQGCGQQSEPQQCPELPPFDPESSSTADRKFQTTEVPELATLTTLNISTNLSSGKMVSTLNIRTTMSSDMVTDALKAIDSSGNLGVGTAGVLAILFVVVIAFTFVVWAFYAYKNPHSPSGQLLIRYRPSQWHWPKGEARYTAASVHM